MFLCQDGPHLVGANRNRRVKQLKPGLVTFVSPDDLAAFGVGVFGPRIGNERVKFLMVRYINLLALSVHGPISRTGTIGQRKSSFALDNVKICTSLLLSLSGSKGLSNFRRSPESSHEVAQICS